MSEIFERIIRNKLFFILFAIACGIGCRFKFEIVSLSWQFLVFGSTLLIYKVLVNLQNKFLIRNDIAVFNQNKCETFFNLKYRLYLLFIIILLMLSGFAAGTLAASLRFNLMMPKEQITKKIDEIFLIGKIQQFERRENGSRIYLTNIYEANQFGDELYKMNVGVIRINLRQKFEAQSIIGKWIFLKASIMPAPKPAFPNTFDFSQYAFFKGIGAIGYSLYRPKIIDFQESEFSLLKYLENKLNILSKNITSKIKNAMSEPAAGITSAILVGENSQINADDYYALRVAGLAHIIAISGMHVVVVVGIAFFFIRTILLYLIPLVTGYQLALHYSVAKISAVFSILLSAFYVFLSGAPVSAQRALITSSILMLSLVYDKKIHAIKSLCLAAVTMLLITPEALFSPGLQMSFAACFALITTFDTIDKVIRFRSRYLTYFVKLVIASISASLATAPFIIYHFNQFAPYGVLANLVCVPLSDFIIMPFGMISMLLMPLGLEKFTLWPVQYSIDFMLKIAHSVSALPHADIHVPSFSNIGIIIISAGMFVFCISNLKYLRFISMLIMIGGCFFIEKNDDIILLVSDKTFAIRQDLLNISQKKKFIFSSKQKDRFVHEVWQGKIGRKNFVSDSLNKKRIKNCSNTLCITESVIILNSRFSEEVKNICSKKDLDLFVNMQGNQICSSAKINITLDDLKKHGTHLIRYNKSLIIERTY